ncbi:MAG: DUF3288 family protein [Cyanobacteriota bacterium]|jgi:hypothetical protein
MAAQDQKHPQEKKDREIVDRLLRSSPDPRSLGDLARLRIRYKNFPGARPLQRDLDQVLQRWALSEEELFDQTRQLYAQDRVYPLRRGEEQQDWS